MREDANCAGSNRNKRGEAVSSKTHPAMVGSAVKLRKRYVDRPTGQPKIFLIHGFVFLIVVTSWGALVISTLKVGLLRTMRLIPYQGKD